MNVFTQVPCVNEEQTLPPVLASNDGVDCALAHGAPLSFAVVVLSDRQRTQRVLIEEQPERIKES